MSIAANMAPIQFKGNYAIVSGGGSGKLLPSSSQVYYSYDGELTQGPGIGHAFVKRLLAAGCSVLVGDLALRPEAEETARAYPHPPAMPGQAAFVFQRTDVTSWQELSTLWEAALGVFPQVDLVVPCAGVFEPPRSSFWHPPGVVGSPSADNATAAPGTYASIDINLTHPIRLAQLAIGYWTSRKRPGHLLFVGSVAGYTASIGAPLYYASKAGLHGFVMSLAMLRLRLGIRVMCLAPGAVRVSSTPCPCPAQRQQILTHSSRRRFGMRITAKKSLSPATRPSRLRW